VTTKTALILGARSDIARAVARKLASRGYSLQLAARNATTLAEDQADFQLRYGVTVTAHDFDALRLQAHKDFVAQLPTLPDVAVCAVGLMGNQTASENDVDAAIKVLRSNFEGPASVLSVLANRFEERGSGTLVGISSVAGDRGRAVNYVYGSAKAGFTAFLSGMRNRLARTGVHVVTVLPGFVATQMTEGMDLPAALTAQPDEVAERIVRAIERKQDTIYVRPIWRLVMFVIRNVPEPIFKKLKI
jgi:decaprenylphospho-beta-D-erythro-pentofuranosid-2-ulose 2-reductase